MLPDFFRIACHHGNAEMVERILSQQPDLVHICVNRENILCDLLQKGNLHKIVELLLKKGADPNHVDSDMCPLLVAIKLDDAQGVRLLLENNASVYECQKKTGKNPLYELLHNSLGGSIEILRLLLKYRIDPNFIVSNDLSMLGLSVRQGVDAEKVKLLLEAGCDPNENQSIYSPLEKSVMQCSIDKTAVLLDFGANPNCSKDLLFTAIGKKSPELVGQLLKPRYPRKEITFLCCMREYVPNSLLCSDYFPRDMFYEIAKMTMTYADPNVIIETGMTPLSFAIDSMVIGGDLTFSRHLDCVEMLLKAGANPNQPVIVMKNHPPPIYTKIFKSYILEKAIFVHANPALVKMLLDYGADSSLFDIPQGFLDFMSSSNESRKEVARLLQMDQQKKKEQQQQ